MAFPKKYLNDAEEIILDLRPHWFFLVGPGDALLGALVLAIWVGVADLPEWFLCPTLALAFGALLFLRRRFAEWVTPDVRPTRDGRLIGRRLAAPRAGSEKTGGGGQR